MLPDQILRADFLDILFDNKNKAYGAYYLRKTYGRRLRNSILLTTLLVAAAAGGYYYASYLQAKRKAAAPVEKVSNVNLAEVKLQNPDQNPNQPPPPPPPPPPPSMPQGMKLASAVKYTVPEVVKDQEVKPQEQPPNMEELQNKFISTRNIEGVKGGIDPGLVPEAGQGGGGGGGTGNGTGGNGEDKIFTYVEQMPEFPGGEDALQEYLRTHVHYPEMALQNGIQGNVIVQFVVNEDGSIQDAQTIGPRLGGGLEEEALRVIKEMPKWRPGRQNGHSVRVEYTLPFHFILQ